ncbi:PEP/pyruvate-binding domain-containing protein [Roseobacter weihaiensis]|uniref:PEP/pyruvate-binding domain-containing protein n=1 Tax=Roseobacter weihaiensis TaxID=2763262 RepID=UPI001D09C23B|nr:PEP/pyruvate-binding domain-containing protein [Roseobacter sp. H9]
MQSFVSVVLDPPPELVRTVSKTHLGPDDGAGLSPDSLAQATIALRAEFAERGYVVPIDPLEQVRETVGAVFSSWTCERAKTYRRLENIANYLFTAATVQMMAFGNLGTRSGTGFAFSRCPSDGTPKLMGDFLQGAQGEDVVAGTHQTLPISVLADVWPEVAAELKNTAHLLERDLSDLVDIEFTVEEGKL